MRCLVTGGSGFVGSWLVRKLLQESTEVAILVRPTSNLWRIEDVLSRLHILQGNLSDIEASKFSIADFAPDVIFHLAWAGATSQKYVDNIGQVYDNLPGSLRLFRVAHEAGARDFISLGTVLEYGRYSVPVVESDVARPSTLYGASKYAVSLLGPRLCEILGMRFCHIRLFWTYGPRDDERRLLPYVIKSLLAEEVAALTPGQQLWDYLYIEDAADAIYRLASAKSASGVFNLGSGRSYAIRGIVEQLRDMIDPTLPLGFGQLPYSPDQIMHLQADISRIQQATGWSPKTDLRSGLRQTIEWYKRQRQPKGKDLL